MNRKIFSLAVALFIPTSYAANVEIKVPDSKIKIYGQIGAEAASVEYANGDSNVDTGSFNAGTWTSDGDRNRQTLTADRFGSILNDGPNMIGFDFEYEKKVAGGFTPYASYRTTFDTTNNSGFGPGLEAWVGLKNSNFHIKYGKLRGAYRHAKGLIDPWIYTSIQARGTGGGLSSGRYNEVRWGWNGNQRQVLTNNGKVQVEHGRSIQTYGLIHNSDISGALELGFKLGEINARVQIMGDDQSDRHGGNLEFKYTSSQLTVWLIGAYLDPGRNNGAILFNNRQDGIWGKSKYTNWKIGVQYKVMPTLKVAIQYEDAELGTFDNNPDGGKYLIGSADFKVTDKVTLAGWVASYTSNIDQSLKMIDIDGVTALDEDALSVSLGIKYHFTKLAHAFVGYRDTNSDNNYRDENVFSAGMLYKF